MYMLLADVLAVMSCTDMIGNDTASSAWQQQYVTQFNACIDLLCH